MNYREMKISDYESVIELWMKSEGMRLRDSDSREGIAKYLSRNPGLSIVAELDGDLVGTIMSGHDGKRGYIQHMAVAPRFRKAGVGTELLARCLAALKQEGILKSHLFVLTDNESAKNFWTNRGWVKREDMEVYSFINAGGENA